MHALVTAFALMGAAWSQVDYDAGTAAGRITFYEQSGNGACDIPSTEWPEYTAALDENHFLGGLACGATARIYNQGKSIEVMIVDLCPVQGNEQWCSGDLPHFDLGGEATFAQLEPPLSGVREVEFQWRPTPVGDAPVKLRFKDGVNPWWVALEVINHRYPVAKLEIKDPRSGAWIAGNRTRSGMWNYFQFDFTGDGLQAPFDIRITDQYGQVIQERAAVVQEKYQWTGQHQFPLLPRHQSGVMTPAGRAGWTSPIISITDRRLQVSAPAGTRVRIHDLQGKPLADITVSSSSNWLPLPRLPAGLYLISIGPLSSINSEKWFCAGR